MPFMHNESVPLYMIHYYCLLQSQYYNTNSPRPALADEDC